MRGKLHRFAAVVGHRHVMSALAQDVRDQLLIGGVSSASSTFSGRLLVVPSGATGLVTGAVAGLRSIGTRRTDLKSASRNSTRLTGLSSTAAKSRLASCCAKRCRSAGVTSKVTGAGAADALKTPSATARPSRSGITAATTARRYGSPCARRLKRMRAAR